MISSFQTYSQSTCNCPQGPDVLIVDSNHELLSQTDLVRTTYTKICIQTKLIVDIYYGFQSGTEFYLADGAYIQINPGTGYIPFLKNYFYSCGSGMHKGVIMKPGSSATFINGCKMYDAVVGITGEPGSSLAITSMSFIRNKIGLKIDDVHFRADIRNCKFYCDEPLHDASQGIYSYAGIQTDNMNAVVNLCTFDLLYNGIISRNTTLSVLDSKFENLYGSNQYALYPPSDWRGNSIISISSPYLYLNNNFFKSPLSIGVTAVNSNFKSRNNQMELYQGYAVLQHDMKSGEIYNDTIAFAFRGVAISNSKNPTLFKVYQSKFHSIVSSLSTSGTAISLDGLSDDGNGQSAILNNKLHLARTHNGISAFEYPNVDIWNNDLEVSRGIYGLTKRAGKGIFINGSREHSIMRNSIRGIGTSLIGTPEIVDYTGIYVTGSPSNILCCNSVQQIKTGMYFDGDQDANILKYSKFISDMLQALWIGYGHIGAQFLHGNTWSGQTASVEAENGNQDQLQVSMSRFTVKGSSTYYPSPIIDPNLSYLWWYINNNNYQSNCTIDAGCTISTGGGGGGGGDDEYFYFSDGTPQISIVDQNAATGSIGSGTYATGINWTTGSYLYDKLVRYPQLITMDTNVAAFYQQNSGNAISTYTQMRRNLSIYSTQISQLSGYVSAVQDSIFSLQNQLTELQATLNPGDTFSQSYIQSWDELADGLALYTHSQDSIQTLYNTVKSSILAQMSANWGSIPATTEAQQLEKSISQLIIQYIQHDSLPAQLWDSVYSIANQCMLNNQYAVGLARVLFNRHADLELDYMDNCNAQQQQILSVVAPKRESLFDIYPNPSKDRMMVVAADPEVKHVTITIMAMDGRTIIPEFRSLGAGRWEVNTGTLPTAPFTLVFHSDGYKDSFKLFNHIK